MKFAYKDRIDPFNRNKTLKWKKDLGKSFKLDASLQDRIIDLYKMTYV